MWAKTNNAHTAILRPRERSKSLYLRHGFTAADDLARRQISAKELNDYARSERRRSRLFATA